MQKIFRLLMLAAVIIGGTAWYAHWSKNRALNSGNVIVRNQSDTKGKPSTTATPSADKAAPATPAAQNQTASGVVPQDIKKDSTPKHEDAVTLPAPNTLSHTPPNRTLLANSARYQLYRQGDITWRLNTENGKTCVLLATEAQWSKTLVYERGCGAS